MATEAQITTLLGALKNDINTFQTQLEETWSKVQGEIKPIWAEGESGGDKKTRLNAKFQLKAYIQTNRDLKIFEKALAEIETLRGGTPINSNQNKGKVYRLVNTMLKFYNTVEKRLSKFRDNVSDWGMQWWTRASAAFNLTTAAKTAIGAEANIGEDPAKLQEIQTYAHSIELKAYASLIRSALDQGIRQLQDRKTKPTSWWGATAAQERERKRAAADTLLIDKTIKGIYALRFIAKQQETNPNQAYITWLITKIDTMYRENWNLFVRVIKETLQNETFKYVYNQLPIIGYIGTRPSTLEESTATVNAGIANGVITSGRIVQSATPDSRDTSLQSSPYNPIAQIPSDSIIQQEFPDALKAAELANKPVDKPVDKPVETPVDTGTDDIDALVALDQQQGKDVWFFGLKPLKLPEEELPNDWKERPTYRKIADQLNLINYAKEKIKNLKEGDTWIRTIFKEINDGCTSDRQIMYSTKCPTFRTYLEELSTQALNMSAFQFSSPETPTAESYGDVTFTLTIKLSDLTSALTTDAEIIAADPGLRPILQQMKELDSLMKGLTGITGTPISITTDAPKIEDIDTLLKSLTEELKALDITI
jgi:hypothetical protein